MEMIESEGSPAFTVSAPNNPNNPLDGFEGSNTELPVENQDIIDIKPRITPRVFRLLSLTFTTVNVRRVVVFYTTTNPVVQFSQSVSQTPGSDSLSLSISIYLSFICHLPFQSLYISSVFTLLLSHYVPLYSLHFFPFKSLHFYYVINYTSIKS